MTLANRIMNAAMVAAIVGWIVMLLMGCATTTVGVTQPVEIASEPSGAQCTATNGFGSTQFATPAKINIHRSKTVLVVTCKRSGNADASVTIKSAVDQGPRTAGMLFGGGLSTLIDASSGARWKYPERVEVFMETAR